ncbi:MAG: tRNA 2-thiouridine(34) synthase MnmA [Spirochaetes bacterium]|nr:tRNA 2-thiouridine(34) synthase MnmA [Spirochaetota bacterium]
MKIITGMSGGVDSSAAALILKLHGHDVTGITMSVWKKNGITECKKNACYGPDEKEDIEEAANICESIGIPHIVFDCADEYEKKVLSYFRNEYLSGKTPNPCVICNPLLKFGTLISYAEKSGLEFDAFATGHYARTSYDEKSKRHILKKGKDKRKDQSYFLYRLSQNQIKNSIFPLGEMEKNDIRELCRTHNLSVSEKKESQDFYSGDYRELLGKNSDSGEIITSSGEIIGKHNGLWNFTPGQRRGLGISSEKPLYVIKLDAVKNQVIVGRKTETLQDSFFIESPNWISIDNPSANFFAEIKVRHGSELIEGTVEPDTENRYHVKLKSPAGQIAPGQSAVFYDGDNVIGGGIIVKE